jgi:hypothetical protein
MRIALALERRPRVDQGEVDVEEDGSRHEVGQKPGRA